MPLCSGCQLLRDRIFQVTDNIQGPRSEKVEIHASYAELSACADSVCELCMFFRRECWYGFGLWKKHSSQDIAEVMEESFSIHLRLRSMGLLPNRICLGHRIGWLDCVGSRASYGPPKWTRDFLEIREAIPPLERSLEKCKSWLSDCLNHHKGCGRRGTDKSKFRPTRLLDVGPQKQQFIRLVLSKDLEESVEATYATLSYCWGATNEAARTTKENLKNRLESIQVESLPQTLQDAIAVTRALGIQYLWIDALCIIQGENGDWEKELLDMGDIYGQSLLTIAASSASSSNVGFLCRKNGAYWPVHNHHLFDSHATGDDPEVVTFRPFLPTWEDLDESLPLSNRGWVLQERMLASRTLSWTDEGIFWLCGKGDRSEYEDPCSVYVNNSHTSRLHDICEDVKESMTTSKSDAQTESSSDFRRDYFSDNSYNGSPYLNTWYSLVEDLSKRSFTVASDRIPAINGLGKEIASIAGTKFVNGMFKPISARELCWDGYSSQSARRIPGIPSWSWASLDQRVFFRSLTNFQLLAQGATVDSNQIHMCSKLGSLPVLRYGNQWRCSPRGDIINERIYFDIEQDAPQGEEDIVKCVQWITWSAEPIVDDEESEQEYLRMLGIILLSAVDEAQHTYRRIGWAQVVDDGYFEEELTDITLV